MKPAAFYITYMIEYFRVKKSNLTNPDAKRYTQFYIFLF